MIVKDNHVTTVKGVLTNGKKLSNSKVMCPNIGRNTALMQKGSLFHAVVLILVFFFSMFYQYSVIKRFVCFLDAPYLKYTTSTIIVT